MRIKNFVQHHFYCFKETVQRDFLLPIIFIIWTYLGNWPLTNEIKYFRFWLRQVIWILSL